MNNRAVGGRGHKVPYRSRTVRVPEPIIEQIQTICHNYREAVFKGDLKNIEHQEIPKLSQSINPLTKEQAIREARKIISQRKSPRISLEKLLRILYSDDQIKL